jgi:hypothetical protein
LYQDLVEFEICDNFNNNNNLNFEEQDKFALQFQYLTFENQSKDILLSFYTQLTFENQSKDILLPSYTQLTFENQLIGAL